MGTSFSPQPSPLRDTTNIPFNPSTNSCKAVKRSLFSDDYDDTAVECTVQKVFSQILSDGGLLEVLGSHNLKRKFQVDEYAEGVFQAQKRQRIEPFMEPVPVEEVEETSSVLSLEEAQNVESEEESSEEVYQWTAFCHRPHRGVYYNTEQERFFECTLNADGTQTETEFLFTLWAEHCYLPLLNGKEYPSDEILGFINKRLEQYAADLTNSASEHVPNPVRYINFEANNEELYVVDITTLFRRKCLNEIYVAVPVGALDPNTDWAACERGHI